MTYFGQFSLDKERDILVDLYREGEELSYVLRTPNHNTGNLITNLAKLCSLPLDEDEHGLKIIRGTVPCYVDGENRRLWIFRMGNNGKALLRYYCLAIPQLAVSTVFLTLLVRMLHIESAGWSTTVKVAVDTILFVASFFVQKFWVFSQKKGSGSEDR